MSLQSLKVPLFKRETKEVLKFIQKNKEYIEGVYGAPKDWILDGGRHKIGTARLTTDKPFELLKELNKRGIKFSLVCNTSLNRVYFKNLERNKSINNFLQEMVKFPELNSVTIGRTWLSKWFKKYYPMLKQTSSIILPIQENLSFKELYNSYSYVTIPPRYNVLDNLSLLSRYADRIIVFAGRNFCPLSRKAIPFYYKACKAHYMSNSITSAQQQMPKYKTEEIEEMLLLNRYLFRKLCPVIKKWEWKRGDIFKMLDCGIRRFKIAGRTELLDEVINGIDRTISYFKEYIRNKE